MFTSNYPCFIMYVWLCRKAFCARVKTQVPVGGPRQSPNSLKLPLEPNLRPTFEETGAKYSITWMRHGESTSNVADAFATNVCKPQVTKNDAFLKCKSDYLFDSALTPLGQWQARQAVRDNSDFFLNPGGVADPTGPFAGRIYHSYLRRATQTAAILAVELSTLRRDTVFQLVPIPFVQENSGGCKPKRGCTDHSRWDKRNGRYIQWNEQNILKSIIDVVGQLPPNVILNTTYVFGPDQVESSNTSEKKLPGLEPRLRQFYKFAKDNALLSRNMLIVSHGNFIRSLSCLLGAKVDQPCLLNGKNFRANCGIVNLKYTEDMKMLADDGSPHVSYHGNALVARSQNESPSLFPKGPGQNWTMAELFALEDVNKSDVALECVAQSAHSHGKKKERDLLLGD